MTDPILTPEEVERERFKVRHFLTTIKSVDRLCDSHEALRRAQPETRTCATCLHFRKGHGLTGTMGLMKEADDRCCHPSESHPLHWQETYPEFGCTLHAPLAAPTPGDRP